MSALNLMRVYELAVEPEKSEAMQSYKRYQSIVQTVGERSGYPVEIAAAVFSALSPNTEYHQNIRAMEKVLVNERAGIPYHQYKVVGYGQNKRKAAALAQGKLTPRQALKSLKTWSFYNNIVDPSNPDYVTVDGHMYWCWMGQKGTVKQDVNITERIYAEIAGDIQGLARALGMIPCELQAVLWITWKRLHGKAYSHQIDIFPKDFVYAKIIDLNGKGKSRGVESRRPEGRDLHSGEMPDEGWRVRADSDHLQPILKGFRRKDVVGKPRKRNSR